MPTLNSWDLKIGAGLPLNISSLHAWVFNACSVRKKYNCVILTISKWHFLCGNVNLVIIHAQPPLAHISKGTRMPPLRELMILYQLTFYLVINFIFAWRIGPMFSKAHLTIPYAYLNHPYQTSCRMMLWFILFCFPFLHNVFMYIYPICSVPCAKLQVWDLSYAGAAVLLLMAYKTKVTDWGHITRAAC